MLADRDDNNLPDDASPVDVSGMSLEHKFLITSFSRQVMQMSRKQAQTLLIQMYAQQVATEKTYKKLLAKDWGIK